MDSLRKAKAIEDNLKTKLAFTENAIILRKQELEELKREVKELKQCLNHNQKYQTHVNNRKSYFQTIAEKAVKEYRTANQIDYEESEC